MTIQAADEARFRVSAAPPEQVLASLAPAELRAHLRAVQAVTAALLEHRALPALLRDLPARVAEALGVDAAGVRLCGVGEGALPPVIGRMGAIAAAVAARGEPVIVDDVAAFEEEDPALRRLASLMAAPLRAGGELLGVLHAGTSEPRRFGAAELYLLRAVADRVALGLRGALADPLPGDAAAQRDADARWRTLAEVDPNGILVMDDRSTIVAANPAVERIFGYAPGELVGRPMSILIPERFRAAHRAGVERYLATGRRNVPWSGVEMWGLTRSGREVPLEIAFGEYHEEGRHLFAGFVQDLSAWKREEARRAAEHGVTRVLASNVPAEAVGPRGLQAICEALGWELGAFWAPDADGERLRCHAVWHRDDASLGAFARATRDTTLGRDEGLPGRVWTGRRACWLRDVQREDNFPRVGPAREAGFHAAFATPILMDDEVEGVMEFFARDTVEPDEALLGTMEVIGHDVGQYLRRRRAERERDRALAAAIEAREMAEENAVQLEEVQAELEVTNDELQRANQDLQDRTGEAEQERAAAVEANRAKSDFLAAMSHELRTPLNAIVGYTDLLLAGIPETVGPGALRQVERVGLASRHLLSLIEEILTFARFESGRETVVAEPFDACDVVEEVEAIIEPLATDAGLQLRVVTPPGELPIVGDARKLRQILINLLDNAVKFTTTGGVDLMVWEDDGEGEADGDLYFRVRDTGAGIAPEHLRRIFEPFWQADQSNTRTAGGTGLGLAVTQRLARVLGGDVAVESEPGEGTTFTVRLPRTVPTPGPAPAEAQDATEEEPA